jgi:transposase
MSRRRYDREFKLSAVKLVQEQNYTIVDAAQNLGVHPASLRQWLLQFPAEGKSNADPKSESAMTAELKRLREENKRLLMEREILKKATAFFAKEQP